MSLHRRNPKRDAIERDVISALEANGWTVLQLSVRDGPDLVASKGLRPFGCVNTIGRTITAEVKSGNTKLKPGQKAFAERWPGEHYVIRSVDDALKVR